MPSAKEGKRVICVRTKNVWQRAVVEGETLSPIL